MVEFGDEHGRHSIERRTPFLMYGGKYDERVELLDHDLCASMGETVHGGEHHAEAMEERHTDAEFVLVGEAHRLAREETIVGNVVMREHHPFWKSRGARCILHVNHVVAIDALFHLQEMLVLNVLSEEEQFRRVIHTTIFLHADKHHVFHAGEAVAVEVSALALSQFRQHLVGHVYIVALPCSVSDAERVHIRVFAEIFQFALLIVGVDGDEHRSYLRRGIEESEPIGHVGGPDAHIASLGDTNGEQSFSQIIDPLVELFPCEAQVPVGIDDILPIWCMPRPIFEPSTERASGKFVFTTIESRVVVGIH